jgi:hypothetical protein
VQVTASVDRKVWLLLLAFCPSSQGFRPSGFQQPAAATYVGFAWTKKKIPLLTSSSKGTCTLASKLPLSICEWFINEIVSHSQQCVSSKRTGKAYTESTLKHKCPMPKGSVYTKLHVRFRCRTLVKTPSITHACRRKGVKNAHKTETLPASANDPKSALWWKERLRARERGNLVKGRSEIKGFLYVTKRRRNKTHQ